jgi:hypothetical protein
MNTEKQIIELLVIQDKYKVIGTGSDPDILYSSDLDLQNYWKGEKEGISYITKVFKEKFRVAVGEPNIYITDFKCGEINGVPIRWDKKAIQSSMVRLGSRKVKFSEALQMKSVIKLDLVAILDGIYKEFSCNYYFNFDGITNYDKHPREEVIEGYQTEIRELYVEGKSFKTLRRIYSLVRLTKEAPSVSELLQEYFNSAIGMINQCKNQIEILLLILDQKFRKPKKKDLVKNLEWIKGNLPKFKMKKQIIESIRQVKKLKMGEMKKGLEYLLDLLSKIVNEKTRMWIAENKNISGYIK